MDSKMKKKRRSSSIRIKNGELFRRKTSSNISMMNLDDCNKNDENQDKNLLKNWQLPEQLLKHYSGKGVNRFFDWQVECLQLPGVMSDQKNLVYSAPTSAGKTMVADILLFKTLLERRKKAIIILPFVSISMEKVHSLKQVFRRLGLRIDSFAGQINPRGGLQRVDAAVCTIEKANNMINRLLEEKKINDIGLIIVDELHMIGDQSRGYILELLLTKLMHIKRMNSESQSTTDNLQIVGMSATIPNLDIIAKWLDAELYVSNYRPIPLNEHLVVGNEIVKIINDGDNEFKSIKTIDCDQLTYNTNSISHSLIYMAIETMAEGYSALIFCGTRSLCESMAKAISTQIFNIGQKDYVARNDFEKYLRQRFHSDQILCYEKLVSLISTLKRSSAGYNDHNLERVAKFGCAFHHAGMTMEERGTIEQGFRDGTLRILCCTTTLSAGVNLPARRVMITSPYNYGNNILSAANYRQMIGRAGRKGIDILGESYLFCTEKDVRVAKRLIGSEMQPIKSNLVSNDQQKLNDHLLRAVLEVIANEMIDNVNDIVNYIDTTFYCKQSSSLLNKNHQQQLIEMALEWLKNNEFIYIDIESSNEKKVAITDVGRAVISSGVSPSDGQFIYEELKRFRTQLSLLNDLHLVYQTTPIYVVNQQLFDIDWGHYHNLYQRWDKNTHFIAKMIGVNERFLCLQMRSISSSSSSNQCQIHRRFYASLALFELIEEVPMIKVQKKYNLNKAILQSLQQQASTFAGMLSTFCQRLGWKTLAKIFDEFQPRLSFGVQLDLLDLVRLPCMNSIIARQLYSKGYEDVASLINVAPKDIETIIMTSKSLIIDQSSSSSSSNNQNIDDASKTKIYISSLDCTISIEQLSKMIVKEARLLTEKDIGQTITSFDQEIESESSTEKSTNNKRIKIEEQQADTSVFFDDDDDLLMEEFIATANAIDSKNKDDQSSRPDIDNNPSLKLKNESKINNSENDSKIEDNDDECVNNFLESLINNNEKLNPPLLYESSDLLEKNELIKIDNNDSCNRFIENVFINNNSVTIAIHFVLINDIKKNGRKMMINYNKNNGTLSTTATIDNDEQFGIELKSCNQYLKSVFITELNNNKIYLIDNDEQQSTLNYLQQHWYKRLSQSNNNNEKIKIRLVCHDVKQVARCLMDVLLFEWRFIQQNIEWYDVKVAIWLLNPESRPEYNVDSMTIDDLRKLAINHRLDVQYFNRIVNYHRKMINSSSSSISQQQQQLDNYRLKTFMLFNLVYSLLIRLRERNLYKSYRLIEIPSRLCLTRMESNPTIIDRSYMNELEDTVQHLMNRIEQKIFAQVGRKFNLNSPDQVANILYSQEMNLISSYFNVSSSSSSSSPKTNTKRMLPKITPITKKPTTSKIALMRLQQWVGNRSSLPTMIMEWRHLNHALNNSLMAINQHWFQRNNDSLIYARCCEWTATGRITMLHPNLINMDKDFQVKSYYNNKDDANDDSMMTMIHIRKMIISGDNYRLITADYCQLELRILAHLSNDQNLLNVLNDNNVDVFKSIAADWKSISIDEINYEHRQQAKQICYGIIYGMGDESLAEKLEITCEQAAEYKNSFFQRYSNIQPFIMQTIDYCREKGFVQTIAGRCRQLADIESNSKANRQAVNTRIQGSAADIIKIAMVAMQKQIDECHQLDARFVLQMHDELMYRVHRDQMQRFAKLLKRQMEWVGDCLRVVLPVKISYGENWSQMVPFNV